jgi:hypothetical protein
MVMASPLDLWGLVPYLALIWIAGALIELARFSYAEINGRLPPRPFLHFARQCLSEGFAGTMIPIATRQVTR